MYAIRTSFTPGTRRTAATWAQVVASIGESSSCVDERVVERRQRHVGERPDGVDRGGDLGVDGRHDLAPVPRYTLYPLSRRGLWLAVTITPAAAPSSVTAKASTGVGTGFGMR